MTKAQNQKIYDAVKKSISLLDIIRGYGFEPRKDSENVFWLNCPFHNEHTPSLKIDKVKNVFFCHGCNRGGSVIEFIMYQEDRPRQSVLDQFREDIDVTSNKFAIETIVNEMNKTGIDGHRYRQNMHFELRVYLRELLKKNPDKMVSIDDCFREMRMFFFNEDNTSEEMIRKFSDYILEKAAS